MADFDDDSFDIELANIDIPPAEKIAKLTEPVCSNHSQPANTSTSAHKANTKILPKRAPNPHCIIVHHKQRNNPILKSINAVPIEFSDEIVPDYVVGRTSCILYLSLKYHALNPDYICQRIKELGKQYELRVLLIQVDTPEFFNSLKSLTRISLLTDLTLLLAWNFEEAGKIIETYKLLEKRGPEMIQEHIENSPHIKLVDALSHIKPLNKTDAVSLLQNFGNLETIINTSEEKLSDIVGLGPRKARMLYKTLNEPFLS